MSAILINGISARSGGGKSVLVNFLKSLHASNRDEKFVVIVPYGSDYSTFSKSNILIIVHKNSIFSLASFYFSGIKKIARKHNVTLILNLADFIIPIATKQVYLFDWPYAIYPESIVWKRMTMRENIFRKLKLFLFRRYAHLPALFIAQTTVAKSRLQQNFPIKNVEVIPNAVSLDNLNGGRYRYFNLPKDRLKLLYLTKYYPHKNLEVFVSLAGIIHREQLPYTIIATLDVSDKNVKRIVDALKQKNLDDIVINVGPVQMENVPSLYHQCDALLMPSLLESFSGTYVEAMYHSKPIFTSNYDFAEVVCGDAAFYFDPMDPEQIIETIRSAYSKPEVISSKIKVSQERLSTFLSWKQVSDRYFKILENYQ
jgi:glycosyltransferase involved in cell wall biosynthesis